MRAEAKRMESRRSAAIDECCRGEREIDECENGAMVRIEGGYIVGCEVWTAAVRGASVRDTGKIELEWSWRTKGKAVSSWVSA